MKLNFRQACEVGNFGTVKMAAFEEEARAVVVFSSADLTSSSVNLAVLLRRVATHNVMGASGVDQNVLVGRLLAYLTSPVWTVVGRTFEEQRRAWCLFSSKKLVAFNASNMYS